MKHKYLTKFSVGGCLRRNIATQHFTPEQMPIRPVSERLISNTAARTDNKIRFQFEKQEYKTETGARTRLRERGVH